MVGVLGDGPRKKLADAAAWWVRGGGEFDQAREDLRAFGASDDAIDAQLGPEEKNFHVWPENWAAFQAFLDVNTQWITGMSGPTGLDYERVRAGLDMAGVQVTPELFQKLRILEAAVLNALSKKGSNTEKK